MDFQRCICVFLVIFAAIIGSSQAYRFNVGGRDGWVLNPSENYNHWAQRLRFLINDTLFFKYKKGSGSVLVVSRDDYNKCNTDNPIVRMDGGDSEFKFDRSGPFYFIAGNKGNCDKGQKLIIVVLAVRNPTKPSPSAAPIGHAPAVAPPTGSTPMSPSPVVTAPTPAMTPISPSPMSLSPAIPTLVPSPAPINHGPAPTGYFPMAPSPLAAAPTPAMTPVSPSPMSPSPEILTPVSSPAPGVSVLSPSPTPTHTPIVPSPMVSLTPASSASPPGGIAPNPNNTPADVTAPAGPRSAAQAFTPSVVLVSSVSLVLSVTLGSFIIST